MRFAEIGAASACCADGSPAGYANVTVDRVVLSTIAAKRQVGTTGTVCGVDVVRGEFQITFST